MKQTYVLDTMGTTIPMQNLKELNKQFFVRGQELGYTAEQMAEYRAMFENNPKDPRFLRGSSPGKIKLLESGIVAVEFFPDVAPALQCMAEEDKSPRVFTKGGVELTLLMYSQGGLGQYITAERLTSSTDFEVKDKTNPACYEELQNYMASLGEDPLLYVSDDPGETNACQEAWSSRDVFFIDRGQPRSPLASRVQVIRSLEELF